jgi:hypothetical protein
MLRRSYFSLLSLFLSLVFLTACSARVGYRVYDPAYGDYHVWDNGEIGYYNNWLVETHRSHVDFRKLRPADQNEYWKWRHEHH